MNIPNLKRRKISSALELQNWLAKNSDEHPRVMLLLFDKTSGSKFIEPEEVQDVLSKHGWVSGRRYTLNGNMLGHVIESQDL
jgi:hypothetical protein